MRERYELRVASYELRVAGYLGYLGCLGYGLKMLQVASYGLQKKDRYKLHV
jgi:hypothetical protein